MTGTVEIDETYIGGRTKGKKKKPAPEERPPDNADPLRNKAPVVALVQRGGNVQSHYVQRVTAANLRPIIDATIAADAEIMTDSGTVLRGALMTRRHCSARRFLYQVE